MRWWMILLLILGLFIFGAIILGGGAFIFGMHNAEDILHYALRGGIACSSGALGGILGSLLVSLFSKKNKK